ncbi:hypothetical protein EIP86_005489 [Pleurotus ostreatoroseus]|nr:hypothetical protein EIP86_005489 [Pleurotus ostreatoroseus]
MALQSQPLFSVPTSNCFSGRAKAALSELNRVAANPELGASLEQIHAGMKERETRDTTKPDPRDLVELLISENQDIWQTLLKNPFCWDNMRTAASTDQAVLKGFKWYMTVGNLVSLMPSDQRSSDSFVLQQDFLYCVRLMNYEADRSSRAINSAEFDTSADRVADNAGYAKGGLVTCTAAPPEGLGIKDVNVLTAPPTKALTSYTDFQIQTATDRNWVLSLVAMVPCIQSYYQIAVALKDNSVHKDTLWYNLWAVENAKYEDSTIKQREFFIQNFDSWRYYLDDAKAIFRQACQGEIDLWATALDPQDV